MYQKKGNNDYPDKRSHVLKKTGFKNTELEKNLQAIDFFKVILNGFDTKSLEENFSESFFKDLYLEAKRVSETAIAPFSNAFYAAFCVFESKDGFHIHAGSNIDSMKKENLKIAKFRNCAEKQAILSALEKENLESNKLKILFLFRQNNKLLTAEKLLPCTDCYGKYITALRRNNGIFVVISEEHGAKHFLKKDQRVKELKFDDFRLLFFSDEELDQLNLEPEIGQALTRSCFQFLRVCISASSIYFSSKATSISVS